MDIEIIRVLGPTVGPAAGVVIVVFLFLRYLESRDKLFSNELSDLKHTIEELSKKIK